MQILQGDENVDDFWNILGVVVDVVMEPTSYLLPLWIKWIFSDCDNDDETR